MDLSHPYAICIVLGFVVCLGLWMETRQKLSQFGLLSIIFVPAALAIAIDLPRASPVYSFAGEYLVPLSIPLLLFGADLSGVVRQSRTMLVAFVVAALVTLLFAVLGLSVLGLSEEARVWSAISTAGFIGGTANTVAVADSFHRLADPEMPVVLASVYAIALPFMALLLALPSLDPLWRWFSPVDHVAARETIEDQPLVAQPKVTAFSMSAALVLSALIVLMSDLMATLSGVGASRYVAITVLGVAVATLLPGRQERLAGHFSLGQILIYFFFATLGAQLDFTLIQGIGIEIVGFSTFVFTGHIAALAICGRILKLSGPVLLMASNACILGPPSAAAMAAARGWPDLITPGVIVGVLGYAMANFAGILLTGWVLP